MDAMMMHEAAVTPRAGPAIILGNRGRYCTTLVRHDRPAADERWRRTSTSHEDDPRDRRA